MNQHLNSIDRHFLIRLIGWSLLASILYAMACAIILLTSLILFQKGITPSLPWISNVQKHLYMESRNVWQAQPDCVVFDPNLIFRPKDGRCQFDNIEFQTELSFSPEGRYTGGKPTGKGIVVIGDSHAMGWGVNDLDTFSAELQRLSGRAVFNLAVSGYATDRELMRLENSDLLNKVDIVVVQYCDNDLDENLRFQNLSKESAQRKFSVVSQLGGQPPALSGKLEYLKKAFQVTVKVPFIGIRSSLKLKKEEDYDFPQHYQPFLDAVNRHGALKSKRVIVFYSNGQGIKFKNFPAGKDQQLPNFEFVDMGLGRGDYYRMDDHLTRAGHMKIARRLLTVIQSIP
ncbi:SGNH/GDSL hydrolase family protein [Paucibacter sp. AS339]|uniref:SGNH/GDSL hydrolase family protein n=1 Tax=Paucibacter hankyongi TaxID=3133434 RepID=UPI0030B1C4AA